MGAWIETHMLPHWMRSVTSHPYMGAWIETYERQDPSRGTACRTLTWVRGLKRITESPS